MSSRRLVNRARDNQDSSPAQRPRHRESQAALDELTPLPPYEPPSYALTPSAKHALETLRTNHDYSKYKKHLDSSIKVIINSIGDSNDRLRTRKLEAEKARDKRAQAGGGDEEESDEVLESEIYVEDMDKKVGALTTKAEKALRDLIDYSDELAMKDQMMAEVIENIPAVPPPRPAVVRQRRQGSNEDEDAENQEVDIEEEDDPAEDGSLVSAIELLKKAQAEYAALYASKTMRQRYDTNDYKGFKKTLHVATVGPSGPPLAHARTWFPEDNQDGVGHGDPNDEESDDDVVIAHATTNLKCSLTLQEFKEPYSNDKCNHVFEKSAILNYVQEHGTVFQPSQSRRGQRSAGGPKQVKCPEVGCEVMLQLEDFHLDNIVLRQVKQAAREAARDEEEDDDDGDDGVSPTRARRSRPGLINGEDGSVGIEEGRRNTIARVKRERHQSRGPAEYDA